MPIHTIQIHTHTHTHTHTCTHIMVVCDATREGSWGGGAEKRAPQTDLYHAIVWRRETTTRGGHQQHTRQQEDIHPHHTSVSALPPPDNSSLFSVWTRRYIHMHTYVCMYVWMYVCMYVHGGVCVHWEREREREREKMEDDLGNSVRVFTTFDVVFPPTIRCVPPHSTCMNAVVCVTVTECVGVSSHA